MLNLAYFYLRHFALIACLYIPYLASKHVFLALSDLSHYAVKHPIPRSCDRLILLSGMRRSGLHGVANYICSHFPKRSICMLNDCFRRSGQPYVRTRHDISDIYAPNLLTCTFNEWFYKKVCAGVGDYQVKDTLEPYLVDYAVWHKQHQHVILCVLEDEAPDAFDSFLLNFNISYEQLHKILLVRDLEPWLKSRLRTGNHSFSTTNLEVLHRYAEHKCLLSKNPSDIICCNFDELISSKDARRQFVEEMGLAQSKINPWPLDAVPSFGGGSSHSLSTSNDYSQNTAALLSLYLKIANEMVSTLNRLE